MVLIFEIVVNVAFCLPFPFHHDVLFACIMFRTQRANHSFYLTDGHKLFNGRILILKKYVSQGVKDPVGHFVIVNLRMVSGVRPLT